MKIAGACSKFRGHIWPRFALRGLLLASLCGLTACAADHVQVLAPVFWNPARLEGMELAAKQAREKENMDEADRLCVEALQYVYASTLTSLYGYTSVLKGLGRPEAEAALTRADKLRELMLSPSGGELGWEPPTELRAYAALLEEVGRIADAEAIMKQATAYTLAMYTHNVREFERGRGGDPRGTCVLLAR